MRSWAACRCSWRPGCRHTRRCSLGTQGLGSLVGLVLDVPLVLDGGHALGVVAVRALSGEGHGDHGHGQRHAQQGRGQKLFHHKLLSSRRGRPSCLCRGKRPWAAAVPRGLPGVLFLRGSLSAPRRRLLWALYTTPPSLANLLWKEKHGDFSDGFCVLHNFSPAEAPMFICAVTISFDFVTVL